MSKISTMTRIIRRKVTGAEQKILDSLVKKYESPDERLGRAKRFLLQLRDLCEIENVSFNKDKFLDMFENVEKMGKPSILFEDLKILIKARDNREIIKVATDVVRSMDSSVDMSFKKRSLELRIISPGNWTRCMFAVRMRTGEEWIMRFVNNETAAWEHLKELRGGQKECRRSKRSVKEEYCGINLLQLYEIANDSGKKFLKKLCKGFDVRYVFTPTPNIAYSSKTKELIVIDRG